MYYIDQQQVTSSCSIGFSMIQTRPPDRD